MSFNLNILKSIIHIKKKELQPILEVFDFPVNFIKDNNFEFWTSFLIIILEPSKWATLLNYPAYNTCDNSEIFWSVCLGWWGP